MLVRLNSANEQATLNALETSAKLASVQAQRWQQLSKDKLVSLDDVQQRAAAASARAQVEAQRALIAQKISGMTIGTLFTWFVLPAFYLFLARDHAHDADHERVIDGDAASVPAPEPRHG